MHATVNEVNAELRALADAVRRGFGPAQVNRAPSIDLTPVILAFETAKARGVATPRLLLGSYEFTRAPDTGRNPGAIYVKTIQDRGGLPPVYLGKVLNGRFLRDPKCLKKQEEEILAIAENPRSAALAFGRKWGKCSVCNRTLTDKNSVEAGIGPICATKYGF